MCNSQTVKQMSLTSGQFRNSHSLVLLQKLQNEQLSGNEESGERDYLAVDDFFLMSRGDPRTGSGGCRGALCSGSERRRWRDRRCTWVEGDCWSDSEDRKKERQVVTVSNRPVSCVWVNPAFEL